jgi:hypothetical protein
VLVHAFNIAHMESKRKDGRKKIAEAFKFVRMLEAWM